MAKFKHEYLEEIVRVGFPLAHFVRTEDYNHLTRHYVHKAADLYRGVDDVNVFEQRLLPKIQETYIHRLAKKVQMDLFEDRYSN